MEWLKNSVDRVFGFPRLIRFSWSTADRLLEQHSCQVKWNSDEQEEDEKPDLRRYMKRKNTVEKEQENELKDTKVNKNQNQSVIDFIGLTSVNCI